MACSFFVQTGKDPVFAIAPLIKPRLSGQIVGMTWAYGNVATVVYLKALSMGDSSTFFLVIAATATIVFLTLLLI